jgi:drug/metabolite transporter (DMT)-like permease
MGILAKLSYVYGIRPETLIALRLVIGFVTLLSILAVFSRESLKIRKTDVLLLLVLGAFAVALQRVTYFYAISLTTATMAAILFYTYPVFVNLLAWFFLKEKTSFRGLLAIVLTFLGVALVVRVYDTSALSVNLVGIILGLTASLLFVLYFFMTRKLRDRYTSWTLTLYGEGIGALVLTPVISCSISQITDFPIQLWLLILTIAWFPSLLAYLLFSYALKHVKASKGSILSVIEPLSAAVFSTIFIGERLETPQIVGIVLALTGVVLLFRRNRVKG